MSEAESPAPTYMQEYFVPEKSNNQLVPNNHLKYRASNLSSPSEESIFKYKCTRTK